MRKIAVWLLFITMILLIGCASTGSFKKNERVSLVLQNGHKIKCYVTHLGKSSIFFQALSANDAYNYGDMLLLGQIKKIKLADNTEMSVAEYREYRKNVSQAIKATSPLSTHEALLDPLYEKLKHKDIDKMSDKEFRYFLLMKEQENVIRLRESEKKDEVAQLEKIERLNQKMAQLQAQEQLEPMVPIPESRPEIIKVPQTTSHHVERSVPAPAVLQSPSTPNISNNELAKLLNQADLTGQMLRKAAQLQQSGAILSSQQQEFIRRLENSGEWREFKVSLEQSRQEANTAMEEVYLTNPEAMSGELGLVFNANENLQFNQIMDQLYDKIGPQVDMGEYRQLVQIFGQTGGKALKKLIEYFEDWQFVQQN